jgi:hypothetical protein
MTITPEEQKPMKPEQLVELIDKLKEYDFKCEAGDLLNCKEFILLAYQIQLMAVPF